MEISNDFINYSLTIFGLGLTIYFFYRGRRIKKLVYFKDNNPILDEKNVFKKLTVTYENEILEKFSNTIIIIANNGSDSIKKSDISNTEPISFNISNKYKILDHKVLFTSTESLKVNHTTNKNMVHFEFEFLNPGEGFVINLLHNGSPTKEINVTGRINNLKEIKEYKNNSNIPRYLFAALIGILLGLFKNLFIDNLNNWVKNNFQYYLFFFLGILLISALIFLFNYLRKRFDNDNRLIENLREKSISI